MATDTDEEASGPTDGASGESGSSDDPSDEADSEPQSSSPPGRGELVWFLVDRSEQHAAVEAVARRLEAEGVSTEVVTITEVLGSAAREAVAGGAERILRGLRIALQGESGQEDFLQAIRREQPDLLVVTSARYARPLSLLESVTATTTAQLGLPLDFNFGAEWMDGSIDAFVLPDDSALRSVEQAGYGSERRFRAGPPLLPNFEQAVDRAEVRRELGFEEETVVLVRAESFDATALDRLVFQATLVEGEIRFVFHHNGDGAVSQTLRRSADHHGLPAAMFGRVPDLERYVTAADVVLATPAEPFLPEIVHCRRPLFLVGADEGFGHQVDVLTRSYGAEHLEEILRLGSELESFLDPDRFEEAERLATESPLDPGNESVFSAVCDALDAAPGWQSKGPERSPDSGLDPEDERTPGDEPTGPFESIGDGEGRKRPSRSREPKGALEPADGERRRPSISRAEAKDQLAELILDERRLERRLQELEREQERWRSRLELARDWGEEDLADEAEQLLREYLDDASAVEDELEDVRRQKEKLKRAARRGEGGDAPRERSGEGPVDDADRAAELEERFEEMELERDLDDLRDRVEGELGE